MSTQDCQPPQATRSSSSQIDEGNQPTILPKLGVLEDFDDESRTLLAGAGEFKTLPAKSQFAVQGEPQDSMAIILDGKVTVSCRARVECIQLAELGPGEIVGEMSLIDPQNASATVAVVGGKARFWVLTASEFDAFVSRHPDLGFRLLKVIASRLCRRIRRNSEGMLRMSEKNRHRFLDLDY